MPNSNQGLDCQFQFDHNILGLALPVEKYILYISNRSGEGYRKIRYI
jgi:hypothetical protein